MTPRVRCLGCGSVGEWGRAGRCDDCRLPIARERERDPKRRSLKRRRYDADHRRQRREWLPHVNAGVVRCGRCGDLILPHEPWDLDHLEHLGVSHPSHAGHNRAATRPRTTHQEH